MILTTAIQDGFLALLCFDDSPNGGKLIKALIPYKQYDPFYREVAESVHQYIEQYSKPPGEHTLDLIQALCNRHKEEKEAYERIYRSVYELKDSGINRDFLIKRASYFVREQRLKATMAEAVVIMEGKSEQAVEQVEGMFAKLNRTNVELLKPGLLFNDPEQALSFTDADPSDIFLSGVRELDALGLGPARGELWIGVAPLNRGKSWLAVHKGVANFRAKKRVLHITLEMSEQKVSQRYVQMLYSVGKREAKNGVLVKKFKRDSLGHLKSIDELVLKDRPHLEQHNIRSYLEKKHKPLARRPRLIIKQFPTGSLTIPQLKGYLDYLEGSMNFLPDLILLDYSDLMKIDSKNKTNDLGQLHIDLRGIAVERNIAVATYSQSNRLGLSAKVVSVDKIANDISKGYTADTIVTLNQTAVEEELGLARLFVAKARNDKKGFQVLISQCYGMGQFCCDSILMESNRYWQMIDTPEDEEESDD